MHSLSELLVPFNVYLKLEWRDTNEVMEALSNETKHHPHFLVWHQRILQVGEVKTFLVKQMLA